jgi:formyl-CoA transferase
MVIDVEHPVHGKIRQFGVAIKLSDTPGTVRAAAPAPGEHTDAVLGELGLAPDEIARLRSAGVVA